MFYLFIKNLPSASSKLTQLLHSKILQTYRINQILTTDERLGVKSEAPQPAYDVIVSVLNPKPKLTHAQWNVALAAQSKNLYNKLQPQI